MIIESAQSAFAAAGYANTATGDVASGAGIAPAAIYRYFPSKRDLYLAALRDAGPRLLALLRETAGASPDPLETIWRFGLAYYDRSTGRAPYASLWFQALADASDAEVRETIAANFTTTVGLLEQQLKAGQGSGDVRTDIEPRIAAWHFMAIGLTFDLLHHLGLDDELDRPKVEAWGRLYLDSIKEERREDDGVTRPQRPS